MQLKSNNEEPFRFLSEHFIIFENARDFVQIDDQKGWRILLFCIEGRFQIEVSVRLLGELLQTDLSELGGFVE